MSATKVVKGFLLHSKPFKENAFLCDIFCLQQGRIRCQLSSPPPEFYREFEVKLNQKNDFNRASGFRYLDSPLVSSNESRLRGFYVNELTYRLLPLNFPDETLFGVYKSTLIHLELNHSVPAALRFFEGQLLIFLGHQLNFNQDSSGNIIENEAKYQFVANVGFVLNSQGRYTGEQLNAAKSQNYKTNGVLSMIRECQSLQIDSLLEGQRIYSRQWQLHSS